MCIHLYAHNAIQLQHGISWCFFLACVYVLLLRSATAMNNKCVVPAQLSAFAYSFESAHSYERKKPCA